MFWHFKLDSQWLKTEYNKENKEKRNKNKREKSRIEKKNGNKFYFQLFIISICIPPTHKGS